MNLFWLLLAAAAVFAQAPRERRFGIDYTVSLDNIPTLADTVEIWIPVPHDDAFQTISHFDVDSDFLYQIQTGAFGNRILHLKLGGALLNRRAVMLTMRFVVKRREHLGLPVAGNKLEHDHDMQRWLGPDRLVPLDDKIRIWAQEVVDAAGAKSDIDKARAIYNHIVATVKYDKSGQGWGRGDIYYACETRRGNCTDSHAIFIGYARALGIPARFSIGLPLPRERGQGVIAGYHCWAEFYSMGMGWIPVDASEAVKDPARREYFFGAHDENRVEFSRGRDLILTPQQHGEPLNYFVYPYVEVDGKPYTQVKSTFRYADLKR